MPALPGEYLVQLHVGDEIYPGTITVRSDPMLPGSKCTTNPHDGTCDANESPGKERTLRAGEELTIPPEVEPAVCVLRDSVVLDFFALTRPDWRERPPQHRHRVRLGKLRHNGGNPGRRKKLRKWL